MRPITNVLRLGLSRGWIEYWIQALTWQGLLGLLLAPAVLLGVLWLLSGRQDEGVSMALWMLPGFLTLQLVQEGLSGVANKLALDRED